MTINFTIKLSEGEIEKAKQTISNVIKNDKKLNLTGTEIKIEGNEVNFFFYSQFSSDTFRKIYVLIEHMTYNYSEKIYNKYAKEEQHYFTDDSERVFVISSKDGENRKSNKSEDYERTNILREKKEFKILGFPIDKVYQNEEQKKIDYVYSVLVL